MRIAVSPLDGYRKPDKKQFIVRLILHCVLLYGIVILAGYLFRWYGNVFEFVFVTSSFFLIYALVWLAT